jgi:sulfonate transport system permease protein
VKPGTDPRDRRLGDRLQTDVPYGRHGGVTATAPLEVSPESGRGRISVSSAPAVVPVRVVEVEESVPPLDVAETRPSKRFDGILPAVVPVLILVAWQVATAGGGLSSRVLPRPGDVASAAWHLMRTGELLRHVEISSARAFSGFLIGGSIGFAFGVLNGYWKLADRLFDTPLQMVRNVPHLALIPMVIIWFGLGEEAKVFLVALGVFFPVYVNTLHGVRSVDPGLIEMARVFHLSRWELFRKVIFPGAIPSVLVGVRFGLGVMWLTLIVAETMGADSGIGYLAMNAREFMQTDVVVACVVLYALLGKWADVAARWLERRFLAWHPSHAPASGRAR